MIYTLPSLPYPYDALDPHIDARTMEVHHDKHHAAYVAGVNKAVEGLDLGNPSIEELLRSIHTLPDSVQTAVRNHGGGHANHSLFWTILSHDGGGEPKGELARAINQQLGGFDTFKQTIIKAGLGRFGSGWAWLCLTPDQQLVVEDTGNQDSPLMRGHTPILGIDVWEHAYYLKYQNRRADYLNAIFNVLDWDAVARRYQQSLREAASLAHNR
jgi:superoxide dismutase, Fe-Mn family